MIKIIILLANVLLPLTTAVFAFIFKEAPYRWSFALVMSLHVAIRVWETFFTSKEKEPQKFEGDWTLAAGSLAYIAMLFVITVEFYLSKRTINWGCFYGGIVIYGLGTRLRWWGATTLGSQWAVHVVGKQKSEKTRLLTIGPYAYIRNPIYLGILLDELAIPLIANTFYSLLFIFLVNIPLWGIRLILEERNSGRKFDRFSYADYKKTTGMLFPKANYLQFLLKLLGLGR